MDVVDRTHLFGRIFIYELCKPVKPYFRIGVGVRISLYDGV